MLEQLDVVDLLLSDHTADGEHGEAAVVQLTGLHGLVLLRVGRLQAEGVELEVAHLVVFLDGVEVIPGGGSPAHGHA
eukprot:6505595-Pyramimonas_sp.AAC.1